MTFTSDERREAVRNLRDQAEAWRSIMPDIRMSDRRLTDSIHMAFGLSDKDTPVHEALDMLVDLIDRPTCTIVHSWQEITPGLDELDLSDMCGFELSCGHEVQGYEKPKYCSKCGAVVVDED